MLQWRDAVCIVILCMSSMLCGSRSVHIFHLIDNARWGEVDGTAVQGTFPCFDTSSGDSCKVSSSDCSTNLLSCLKEKQQYVYSASPANIFVSLYHIHSWGTMTKWPHGPDACSLPSHYTIAESEESHGRFHKLFKGSFVHYDGNSTTSPFATVQRTYFTGLNTSEFLPLKPFNKLIKGASFVASTCHKGEGTTKRTSVVIQMQKLLRVDSLGRCHTTRNIPEGITLSTGKTTKETLAFKQAAISNYLFYCAFENTYEAGYVTEKVFDALIAGVVPVYLGPSKDCRSLLPSPNAAIFFDDFNHDVGALSTYLLYLSENKTAYEEHRAWRHAFDPTVQSSPLFTKSWPCRLCEWAAQRAAADNYFEARQKKLVQYMGSNATC